MPPMAMTRRMPITRRIEFFSSAWCLIQSDMTSSFRGLERRVGRDADRLAMPDGHPEIIDHDQRANEEQRAAQSPDRIERMHRLHRLDEGIFEESDRCVGAPHQALQDAR